MPGAAVATLLIVIGCAWTTDWSSTIESIRMERLYTVHVPDTRTGMEAAIRNALKNRDLVASMASDSDSLRPAHRARASMLLPEADVDADFGVASPAMPNASTANAALDAYEKDYNKFLSESRVESTWHSLTDHQKMKKGAEPTWKQRDAVQALRYRIERDGRHVDAAVQKIKDTAKQYGLNDDSVIKRMLRHANLKVDPLD